VNWRSHLRIEPFDLVAVAQVGAWGLNRSGAGRHAVAKCIYGISVRRECEDHRGEEAVARTDGAFCFDWECRGMKGARLMREKRTFMSHRDRDIFGLAASDDVQGGGRNRIDTVQRTPNKLLKLAKAGLDQEDAAASEAVLQRRA
jgi:hypothetical protein